MNPSRQRLVQRIASQGIEKIIEEIEMYHEELHKATEIRGLAAGHLTIAYTQLRELQKKLKEKLSLDDKTVFKECLKRVEESHNEITELKRPEKVKQKPTATIVQSQLAQFLKEHAGEQIATGGQVFIVDRIDLMDMHVPVEWYCDDGNLFIKTETAL